MFAAAAVSILLVLPACGTDPLVGSSAALRPSGAPAKHEDPGPNSPLGKVIGLLQGMLEKSKQEKHEEKVQYTKYKLFCDSTEEDKKKAIEDADAQIELLEASIQKFETETGRLEGEIGGHQEDVKGFEADLASAAAQRKVQNADYSTLLQDYTESLEALEKAIQVLKLQDKKTPGASALLERVKASRFTSVVARRAIESYLAQDPEEPDLEFVASSAPTTAYEFRSGDIVKLLEELLDKFRNERTALEEQEVKQKHAYTMLKQDLTNSVKDSNREISQKSQAVITNKQKAADAQSELEAVTSGRADDAKYLEELTETCSFKAADFESRQKLRAEEIQVIEKVITLLSSEKVAAASAQRALLQQHSKRTATSLAQLMSSPQDAQERVAAFLRSQSTRLDSDVLSTLAMRVQNDPFSKVKQLIEELIFRLKSQATAEAEHKGWCDTELATNKQTRTTKAKLVESLKVEMEQLDTKIALLDKDIAELSKAVGELTDALDKAVALRAKEKAENEETIATATSAQTEVANAIKILKEFYAKAGKATALLQRSSGGINQASEQDPPPIFESPYKGMQQSGNSVMAFLEVIQSDLARLESETKHAETTAQHEFEVFEGETRADVAAKNKSIDLKKTDVMARQQDLLEAKRDAEVAKSELDGALEEFEKLKPVCMAQGQTVEERFARRKEEIEALKQALEILEGVEV